MDNWRLCADFCRSRLLNFYSRLRCFWESDSQPEAHVLVFVYCYNTLFPYGLKRIGFQWSFWAFFSFFKRQDYCTANCFGSCMIYCYIFMQRLLSLSIYIHYLLLLWMLFALSFCSFCITHWQRQSNCDCEAWSQVLLAWCFILWALFQPTFSRDQNRKSY